MAAKKFAGELRVGDEVVLWGRVTGTRYSVIHRMTAVTCELLNGDEATFWVAPDEPYDMFE